MRPNSAVCFANRSLSYAQLGDWQSSLHDAERCVALDANSLKGWHHVSVASEHLGRLEQAVTAAKTQLSLDPSVKTTHELCLRLCQRMGQDYVSDVLEPVLDSWFSNELSEEAFQQAAKLLDTAENLHSISTGTIAPLRQSFRLFADGYAYYLQDDDPHAVERLTSCLDGLQQKVSSLRV